MAARSLPYPILEDESLSYPDGQYGVQISLAKNELGAEIKHEISGAPFIERAISDGWAQCGCLVAIPTTGHRKIHLSKPGEFEHSVVWGRDVLGEPPFLRPFIVAAREQKAQFTPEDGLHQTWHGKTTLIPKGARLALRRYYHQKKSSVGSLLEVNLDENLPQGAFRVVAATAEGFFFKIWAAPDLYKFLKSPGEHTAQRRSIFIHAASSGFDILRKDYPGETPENPEGGDWANFRNLREVANALSARGLPHWSEEDFSSDEVAMQLEPQEIPQQEDEE